MLRALTAGLAAVAAGALLLGGGHNRAGAAPPRAERFTTYVAPTGTELSVAQAQSAATQHARIAQVKGALTLTTAHSTFARAHALLMGGAPSAAGESGPGERAEEMRSSVWVTAMTATGGGSFSPIAPVPHGRTGPSGAVMVVVADAHTGFVKEEYVGPNAPSVALLGPTATAVAPAQGGAAAARAASGVQLNREQGYIAGRLSPARIGWPVTLSGARGHRRETTRSLPAREGTPAGGFGFRALAGTYTISAAHCDRRAVHVRGRHTSTIVLHCSGG